MAALGCDGIGVRCGWGVEANGRGGEGRGSEGEKGEGEKGREGRKARIKSWALDRL